MKADAFLDIRPSARPGRGVSRVMAEVVMLVHGQGFAGKVAMAFPQMKTGALPTPGTTLRLWADADTLRQARELVASSPLATSVRLGAVETVGEWKGSWIEYRRFRVPSRRKKDLTPERVEARAKKRAEKIERASSLPFLNMGSRSTSQNFRLMFDPIVHDDNVQGVFSPDGFGLSSEQNPVRVPFLEA